MQEVGVRNTWLRGWFFRVGFVYWMIYAGVLVLVGELDVRPFTWVAAASSWLLDHLDIWVGRTVLGVTAPLPTEFNGSGDRPVDWILFGNLLVIALIAATVWALLDRRRVHDARLLAVLRIVVRYALGICMLGYGFVKVFCLQFPTPSDSMLLQRWGDSSPMRVLWTFMGSSPGYEVFAGLAEVVGGALVLFRRTTTVGVLVLTAVLINVVMLNLCYDVPVKLLSSNLLVMCIWLLLPDVGRMFDFFVRHRAIPVSPLQPLVIVRRRWRIARWVVKYGVIAIVLVSEGQVAWKVFASDHGPEHWSTGVWRVTSFVRDGREVAASDPARWDRLNSRPRGDKMLVHWRFEDARYSTYLDATYDDTAHTIQLAVTAGETATSPSGPVTFHYVRDPGDPLHFELTGRVDGQDLDVKLERVDTSKMLLHTRGFHWISEQPFNR